MLETNRTHSFLELERRYNKGWISELELDIFRNSNTNYSDSSPTNILQDEAIFTELIQNHDKELDKLTGNKNLPTYYVELDNFISHWWIYRSRQYKCLWLNKLAEKNGINFEDVLGDCNIHPRFKSEADIKPDMKKSTVEFLDQIIKDKKSDYVGNASRLKEEGFKGVYSVVGFTALRKRLNVLGPPKVKSYIIDDILLMHKEIQSPLGDKETLNPYVPKLSTLKNMFEQEGGLKEIWYIYGSLASSINYFNNEKPIMEPDNDLEVNIFMSAMDRAAKLMDREQLYNLLIYLYDEYSNDQEWVKKWEKYSKPGEAVFGKNFKFAEDRTRDSKIDSIELCLLISKGLYNIQEYKKNPCRCYDAYIQKNYFYGSTTIDDVNHYTEKDF